MDQATINQFSTLENQINDLEKRIEKLEKPLLTFPKPIKEKQCRITLQQLRVDAPPHQDWSKPETKGSEVPAAPKDESESLQILIGSVFYLSPDLHQVIWAMHQKAKELEIIDHTGKTKLSKRESELVYAAYNATLSLLSVMNKG